MTSSTSCREVHGPLRAARGGSQFAAAISYRALFSLVPLATFVATDPRPVLSAGSADRQASSRRSRDQFELSPRPGWHELDELIAAVPSPWSIRGPVASGSPSGDATGVMYVDAEDARRRLRRRRARSLVRGRLVSALSCSGARPDPLRGDRLDARERRQQGERELREAFGWQPFGFGIVLGVVVPLALTFVVFLLLYRYLPRHRPGWRAALLGGGAAAIGFQAVQIGLAGTSPARPTSRKVYGSASAIFAFLFSVYLSASAFVICAILTAVLDEAARRTASGPSGVARMTRGARQRGLALQARDVRARQERCPARRRARADAQGLAADRGARASAPSPSAAGPPTPVWYGLSRNQSRSSIDVTTTATPPIIVPCTTLAPRCRRRRA